MSYWENQKLLTEKLGIQIIFAKKNNEYRKRIWVTFSILHLFAFVYAANIICNPNFSVNSF